jgi:hypothetical protein
VISGTKKIAAYRVGSAYSQAQKVFGGPYSSTQNATACTARWANGVTISWYRTSTSARWTKACLKFKSAKVGRSKIHGSIWRTNKGLRIGARASQVKNLYPSATGKRSGAYEVWLLQKTSRLSLKAWTKEGRVVFFRLANG